MVRLCLWKMSASPGACIKPGLVRALCHKVNLPSCVARRPLCHKVNLPSCVARQPLCHKVNLPRCEAQRRHLTMTCDIFGTGQTNTLTLCYLSGKTCKPAHTSATLESLKSTRSTKLLENSFCQQVDDWMLLKITEKTIRRNVFKERKRIPG